MTRRVIVDVLIGTALAVAGQFAQLIAGEAGKVMGLPFPYEMAPEDGSIPADLLAQISLMFALAAVIMLVLTFLLGWAVKVSGARDGAQRGAVWVAVVALSQFLLGLGKGVVPVFGLAGVYVYLAGIFLGPILAGLVGHKRPVAQTAPSAAH